MDARTAQSTPDVSSQLASLTAAEIDLLTFSELVGCVNEPNMPSGGGATVRRVIELARPRPGVPILEVGSNTGFTSIEIASWVDAPVTGIDVNANSNAFAAAKARAYGIENVEFVEADGARMPFPDESFGLVFCSNVTSFMQDHVRARDEYYRVLATKGIIAAVPIYYARTPPDDLRRSVEAAIGASLPLTSRAYWRDLFSDPRAVLICDEEYEYVPQEPRRIVAYADRVMQQSHLHELPDRLREALHRRLVYFYELFDRNLEYARYSIMLFRLDHPNPEPVLHETRRGA